MLPFRPLLAAFVLACAAIASGEPRILERDCDLLIVGGDEAGCAAAVQAARLGVERVLLVQDIEWLGGQFSSQGVGPLDEWTIVRGKRVSFPRSGPFLEIVERIRRHNRLIYGHASPGNAWCGTETIEPAAAARIFEEWLEPETRSGRLEILRGWEPESVETASGRVEAVVFRRIDGTGERLRVAARLTIDSSDWGDVIRLSGAAYHAGPDSRERFGEPSAPERVDAADRQEMNPISWCPVLRETEEDAVVPRPPRYDPRAFENTDRTPVWRDWDGSGGIYNPAGWCIYTHRRMVDRRNLGLAPGTEVVVLNWPAHGYPLRDLPAHVAAALEATEPGASLKNIVELDPAQRRIIYEDAKQRALEFLHHLQTVGHDREPEAPTSFRRFRLTEEFGTPDRLPPKPYQREGLRLDALYMLREQDVRAPSHEPLWAPSMVPDGVFGYQFNIDFHHTRRRYLDGDEGREGPWTSHHHGPRDWSGHTHRAMLPLRSLVPAETDGLLGGSKNLGITSMVQSSLRLHGQMMHAGTASATVAWLCLREGIEPREVAASPRHWREVQRRLVRGAGGPGVLLWPWHDLAPDDPHFEAANLLPLAGVWRPDEDSLFFEAWRVVTRGELAATLARLVRALPGAPEWPELPEEPAYADLPAEDPRRALVESMVAWGDFGPQDALFRPEAPADLPTLHRWLAALRLPASPTLLAEQPGKSMALTRAEAVEALYRVLRERGEWLESEDFEGFLEPGNDADGDGVPDLDDPLPLGGGQGLPLAR